jgi:hypothetical protein
VWFDPTKDLGGSAYPTYGFIYQPGTHPLNGSAQARASTRYQLASYTGPRAAR